MMKKSHVVIVGGGFGGVYTAQMLVPFVKQGLIEVTLINKTNYFLFTPLLHEVATGGLGSYSTTESLREIFKGTGVRIIQGVVDAIHLADKNLSVDGHMMSYDRLVVATGAQTNYYNIPGAQEYTRVLKTLSDALSIREEIIDAFEDAACMEDTLERKKQLTFVVVGGGATGVEMVSELAEFTCELYTRHFKGSTRIEEGDYSLHLLNTGPELLSMLPLSLRIQTKKRLDVLGVVLHLGMPVTEVQKDKILFSPNEMLSARFIFWSAGVTPILPPFKEEVLMAMGHVKVTKELALVEHADVFGLGDVALVESPDGKGYPTVAQVAVQQAEVVAYNIIASLKNRPLKAFTYASKGTLVSLGQWYAVGTIFGMAFSGRLMWWIWRTVYLFKFNSWNKRWGIMFEWTRALFFPRDITKLR